MNNEFVIGIDLGGTKISGVLCDLSGNKISICTIPTKAQQGEKVVLERIFKVIDTIILDSKKNIDSIRAIGIGSPGPLDSKKGIVITTPNIPFKNFQLVKPIEDKYGIKTYLDNDGNVAAIGENLFGAGKNTENMVYVTVSTGIGGGAIINGKIYRGHTNNALELGHMTLEKNGPKCNCGNHGCAEALSSGTSIAKQGKKAIAAKKETSLSKYDVITSFEVFKEAEAGDKVSTEIVENSLNYFGICIANLVTIFDPEMIVIGGGVSKAGDILFNKVKKVVRERCFKFMADSCTIVPAALGSEAGVMGAAALAIMESK